MVLIGLTVYGEDCDISGRIFCGIMGVADENLRDVTNVQGFIHAHHFLTAGVQRNR